VKAEGRARHPASQKSSGHHATDTSRVTDRQPAGLQVVRYGSREYDALPADDPRRLEALEHAAGSWAEMTSTQNGRRLALALIAWRRFQVWRRPVISSLAPPAGCSEIARRRFPPNGDPVEWVAHGGEPCPRPPCRCRAASVRGAA
jgi:hypothetical protein